MPAPKFNRFAIVFLFFALLTSGKLFAQTEQGFTYQAVARDLSGTPLGDQNLTVRIAIHAYGIDGELIWSEEHDVLTSPFGLFTLTVGDPKAMNQGGSAKAFNQIDWSAFPYFLRVYLKVDNDFMDMGGSAVQTVPLAQYATSAKSAAGSFSVQPNEDPLPGEALFMVRRKDGQPVFAVYEDMVWVYSDPNAAKGAKGGFAVGGYNPVKGVTEEYLRVSSDSVRIYIDSDPRNKGVKGGFAVGGYKPSSAKGFQDDIYLNVSGQEAVDVVKDKSQIMWYPRKEAFLAGNIQIGSVDSVGQNSTAMGYKSVAMGNYSQAFGYRSMSIGNFSTSFGNRSIAKGEDSYALGSGAVASGYRSFAIGVGSSATGVSSMGLGTGSDALNDYSTAIGYRSEASGLYSHSFGLYARATGERSMALGMIATSSGLRSLSLGYSSVASAPYALSIGANAVATGDTAISIGSGAEASGPNAVAIGTGSIASYQLATAIGYNAIAEGSKSISMGAHYYKSLIFLPPIIIIPPLFPKGLDPETESGKQPDAAKGSFVSLPLFADRNNQAIGTYSIALGNGNRSENGGISLGVYNDALDIYSTAVGFGNQAIAPFSLAAGFANKTEGQFATAFGRYTSAASMNSFAIGVYNRSYGNATEWVGTDPLFQIGNGTGSDVSEQHDAFRVHKNGGTYIYPSNSYYGLYVYSKTDASYPSSNAYGIMGIISRNKPGTNYWSGYFYDTGSDGNYLGFYADQRSGGAIDVAEYIYDTHGDTEAGDVLVADKNKDESVIKSQQAYQTSVLGVVTTDPHMVMGMDLVINEETGEPIPGVSATRLALTGRVPVKITEENGPIEPGDLLTTSSTPGHAMKWTLKDVNEAKDFAELKSLLAENERRRNAIIGKAVSSSSSGDGTVMVLISL
ncbi:MAG: hypothetical protein ABFS28_02955 [Bacteroidota bacterium]